MYSNNYKKNANNDYYLLPTKTSMNTHTHTHIHRNNAQQKYLYFI